jgi:hypothetical protein
MSSEKSTGVSQTLDYFDLASRTDRSRRALNLAALITSASCLLAILICLMIDLAISKTLTWSLYPLVSILYAWLIAAPLLFFKQHILRRVTLALVSVSLFLVPFLYCLEQISQTGSWLFSLGIPVALVAVLYMWVIYYLFRKMINRPWYASAIVVALAIPVNLLIDLVIANASDQAFNIDIWDAMSTAILVVIAFTLFAVGYLFRKRVDE